MTRLFSYIFLLLLICCKSAKQSFGVSDVKSQNKIIIRQCIVNGKISDEWKSALTSRVPKNKIEALSELTIVLNEEEKDWIKLITSKANKWRSYLDSLAIPFSNCKIPDTIYVFLGHSGADDAFTYKYNTVCFDLTALQNNYGAANLIDNAERIDRLFAHEFTHLLHKEWVKVNKVELKTFKDSVVWECVYEGFGMYRSLSSKWLPKNGVLPKITETALNELYPVFVDRLIEIQTVENFDDVSRKRIIDNLSRGQVNKKWGAFTVAIWLTLEANGDDNKLTYWVDKGLGSVILLAKKYLPDSYRKKFNDTYR